MLCTGCYVNCPPFRSNLSGLSIPSHKLAKFLVPILRPLTTNEFTVEKIHFAGEIVDQLANFFTSSLDVDSFYTNILLKETIEVCTDELFKESETTEGLSKSDFKELLSLVIKDSHFIFVGTLYKQIRDFWVWIFRVGLLS